MFGLPLAFTSPWLLMALISLPIIWWLLRLTPPKPQEEVFPPTRILARLQEKEETPAQRSNLRTTKPLNESQHTRTNVTFERLSLA